MADGRQLSADEIKRILKPTGRAYISLGNGYPFGFVDQNEWNMLLRGFELMEGGSYKQKWALVSKMQ